jgi:dienelactone hydrolase
MTVSSWPVDWGMGVLRKDNYIRAASIRADEMRGRDWVAAQGDCNRPRGAVKVAAARVKQSVIAQGASKGKMDHMWRRSLVRLAVHLGLQVALVVLGVSALSSAMMAEEAPIYAEHQDLSYVIDPDGSRRSIRSVADWTQRRKHILLGMEAVMGPLPRPASPVPLDVKIVEESAADGLVRRKLSYHTDREDQRVMAWLLIPKGAKKLPAVLCLHQTAVEGKDHPIGLAGRPTLHYALELAKRGYVTLSPDYPSFGEYEYDFESDEYASGSIKAIYDNVRAIDLLQSLLEVDPERLGCIGHSLGGHNALFTAVFDERIKAVVTSCGFTAFDRYKGGDLTGWTSERYMPRIATDYGKSPERMPFDFPEVLAAIAPRHVFIVAPLHDDNFDVTGVRDSVAAAEPIFALHGARNHLQVVYPNVGHDFPDAERESAYKAFDMALPRRGN